MLRQEEQNFQGVLVDERSHVYDREELQDILRHEQHPR
jgi:hypothetical protein